jgi:rhodanese-related sulfurtransferase
MHPRLTAEAHVPAPSSKLLPMAWLQDCNGPTINTNIEPFKVGVKSMKKLGIIAAILIACMGLYAPAHASSIGDLLSKVEGDSGFKMIHSQDLASMMAKPDSKVMVFDANSPDVRHDEGIIPGAHLLASSSHYDVGTTLPPDKNTPIVFYCHDTLCMASHAAARRAVGAGYKNVNVMSDGIVGWKDAGEKTASAQAD